MRGGDAVERAIGDLRKGKPVLLYDWPDREGEVDMVFHASFVDQEKVYELRTQAGGLICFATTEGVIKALDIPFLSEILESSVLKPLCSRAAPYGDESRVAIWVNSVHVRTGISDVDRALTISQLYEVVSLVCAKRTEEAKALFYSNFYAPGHVPVLAASDFARRRGHTELAIALASMADLRPGVVYAEMLSRGRSMSVEDARRYAEEHDLTLVTGEEVLEALRRWDD